MKLDQVCPIGTQFESQLETRLYFFKIQVCSLLTSFRFLRLSTIHPPITPPNTCWSTEKWPYLFILSQYICLFSNFVFFSLFFLFLKSFRFILDFAREMTCLYKQKEGESGCPKTYPSLSVCQFVGLPVSATIHSSVC